MDSLFEPLRIMTAESERLSDVALGGCGKVTIVGTEAAAENADTDDRRTLTKNNLLYGYEKASA